MTPQRYKLVRAAFEAAIGQTPESRVRFVREEYQDDPELIAAVLDIVSAYEADSVLLDTPLITEEAFTETDEEDLTGRQLGAYRIERLIGRGGMGSVYLAKRVDQSFERQVAIKVARFGFLRGTLVQRIKREREILARLDHLNIATLLDAGATDTGSPFIVMEYVEGIPLTEYCDQNRLSVSQRIALFQTVCKAVSYAHQRLIVHRDLKPSNILVTPEGIVKLLDFGIARVLAGNHRQGFVATTLGNLHVFTPEYASPEQFKNEQLDTGTDVYSLGVVLYELLTRRRPYRLDSRVIHEIARIVCEEEPTKPSISVEDEEDGSLADRLFQNSATGKLQKRLRGDLDNILLKALRKEPSQRYHSVDQFSEDLNRHLLGLPIEAVPHSALYNISRFIKRRKKLLAVSLIVVGLISGAFAITAGEYNEAAKSLARANQSNYVALVEAADAQIEGGDYANAKSPSWKGLPKPNGDGSGTILRTRLTARFRAFACPLVALILIVLGLVPNRVN